MSAEASSARRGDGAAETTPLRLVFMGTPEFSVPTLEALVEAGHAVEAAYTQPPRPAGRGKKPRPSPVQAAAEALGIETRTPLSLRDPDAQAALAALEADAAVVVAYGLILPQAALDAPRLGCFNLHASLLPRWRGAAPIQRAIMAGDETTGVCVMRMEAGLDTGPVLARAETAIASDETAASLHDRLARIGAPLMAETLTRLARSAVVEAPQSDDGVTYAAKISKTEARIDWTRPAAELDRVIRGLSPAPGAWFELEGERIKVLMCRVESTYVDGAPGQALDDELLIACGEDDRSGEGLRLLTVQRAGRGPVSAAEFLNGRPTRKGAFLA